jgi:microcystin-dependent protein
MTDFTLPVNTTLVANVLGILRDRDASIAKMDFTGDTNLTAGFLRYNRTNRVFEEWSGTAWVEMRVEPAGIIKAFGGGTAPRGHLLCDGAAVSRTTYADLFSAIGTTYGVGDNSTTFNLPDLRGRFPLGKATAGTGSTMGTTGGSLDHVHNVQSHFHGKGTIAIADSGIHTTTVSINHGHTATMNKVATGVRAKSGATYDVTALSNVTLSDGGHAHIIEGHGTTTAGDGRNTGNSNNKFAKARQTAASGTGWSTGDTNGQTLGGGANVWLNNGNHAHTVLLEDPTHDHSITVAGHTGNTSDSASATRGQHSHTNADVSGLVGATASGRDGDAGFNTLGANPPFQVVNYIISF